MSDSTTARDGISGSLPAAGRHPVAGSPVAHPRLPGQRGDEPSGPGRPTGRRRLRRVLKWFAVILALVVLGTAAAGYAYYRHLNHNIRKGQRSSGRTTVHKAKPNAAGQTPMNILLLGSDGRDSAEDLKLGGARSTAGGPARADVEMLLHVSADRRHAAIVSIPRDTRVNIPECTDPKTGTVYPPVNTIINASLARGGPGCTLATWENLTGVYIDHWMMVDFAGVVKMADAIGGVDVCVKENLWDHPTPAIPHGGSGLKLTAGTHRVTGKQALQWLRTRDAFGSDLGRAQAQHMYLASMVRELRAQNLFENPARLMSLAETATRSIEVSSELGSVDKLYDLAQQLKNVPPDHITMTTMPNIPDPQDPQAHLLPNPKDAPKLWAMLRDDVPFDDKGSTGATPSASPSPSGPPARPKADIPVTVVNGTAGDGGVAVSGRASTIGSALVSDGFAKARVSQVPAAQPGTTLVYPASAGSQGRADAIAVAGSLHIPADSVKASTKVTAITLTIGADWTSGTDYTAVLPSPGALPHDADALNGADAGACMDVYAPYRW
jgi:LCP family protein required for cell wall assembly